MTLSRAELFAKDWPHGSRVRWRLTGAEYVVEGTLTYDSDPRLHTVLCHAVNGNPTYGMPIEFAPDELEMIQIATVKRGRPKKFTGNWKETTD